MEVYSPDEVAKLLKIKPATLRKYAIMLEKRGYVINRNSQNHRYYNDKDIITLRRVITGKQSDVTLDEVIDNVISVKEHNTYTNDTNNDIQPYNDAIQELKDIIHKQSEQISIQNGLLKELTERIDQQQKYILDQQEQELLEQQEEDKKGFFSRLFKK